MPSDDKDLKPSDIQVLSNSENIAAFFSSLGYNTDDKSGARIKQSVSALGITPDTIAKTIKHVERLADQENGALQVYLFELSSVTVMTIRALSRAFRDRAGKYLLVLTSDYEDIDFIFLERVLPSAKEGGIATKGVTIRPHTLTVKRRDPGTLALRVLRRFTYTESDADAQADKLLSAFSVAEWSERLFNNRALFSDYYLLERLPQSPEWSLQIKPQLLKLRELFANVREKFGNQKEAVARERLLRPIFELLGFTAVTGKESKSTDAEPDYRLYQKEAGTSDKPLAVCLAYTWNRYLDGKDETRDTETPDENPGAHVVTLLEAGEASWAIVTNGKVWRLYSSKAHSRATNYYEIDLEETLAMQDPQEAFRFFWLLFRAQAFTPVEEIHEGEKRTTTFLDRLIEESETYAKELGEKLKSRVFDDIFPHFAEGFIEHMGGSEHLLSLSEGEREKNLSAVFQGTLTFLYRLLFLLYSESRNLLPVNEVRGYWDLSLSRLKKAITDHAGTIIDEAPEKIKKAYRQDSSELYTQLSKLFGVIDQGDADVNVPLYNGGLFITNPSKDDESPEIGNARFLRTNNIPDRYLALGLDMMARGEDNKTHALVAIDYKSLGVRHLGSIYEGLLEFKLRIATEKMAVVKGKKTEEIVSYKEAKKNELPIMTIGRGKNAEERVLKKGTVYLENDKRERKATGSYYTPDYIVKYIVENTVGPVLAEKLDALRPKLREAQLTLKKERDKYKALGGKGDSPENQTYLKHRQLVDDLFNIKVLDPAMGSGHFLVEAVDFISDKILGDKEGFLRAFPWNPITAELQKTRQTILNEMEKQGVSIDKNRLTDVNLLKRHILKRCIYGVDLNPMAVELAKVSLWLDCFTLGAPLSFLDHHLRCGNSLIGITEQEFEEAQKGQMDLLSRSQFIGVKQAVGAMIQVGSIPDITSVQAAESRKQYHLATAALAPIKRLFDVYVSQWFGNVPVKSGAGKKEVIHNYALEFLRDGISEEWAFHPNKTKLPRLFESVTANAISSSVDMSFFHWELEFPEVFYGARPGTTQVIERLEGAGFDAIIGNPPYVGFHGFENIKDYLRVRYATCRGKYDIYVPFWECSMKQMAPGKRCGFITPSGYMKRDHGIGLRKYLLNFKLDSLHDFEHECVFDGATNYVTILIVIAIPQDNTHQFRYSSGALTDRSHIMIDQSSLRESEWMIAASNSQFLTALIRSPYMEKLGDISEYLAEGIVTGKNDVFILSSQSADYKKIVNEKYTVKALSGDNINRYSIDWNGDILVYPYEILNGRTVAIEEREIKDTAPNTHAYLVKHKNDLKGRAYFDKSSKAWFELWNQRDMRHQMGQKIVVQENSIRCECEIDDGSYMYLDTCCAISISSTSSMSLYYLLSVLNSKLLDHIFRIITVPKAGGHFIHKPMFLEKLPIRKIHFVTAEKERRDLLNGVIEDIGKNKYESVLSSVAAMLPVHLRNINDEVEEKTDVVHDILAYLAQQLVELNKSKAEARNSLLAWIETKLKIQVDSTGKCGIDALNGKTVLKEFAGDYQRNIEQVSFEAIWDVLMKNKGRLGVHPDSAFQTRLKDAHSKSLSIILPIEQKAKSLDDLTDQIVYRLYGLSGEQIEIVESLK